MTVDLVDLTEIALRAGTSVGTVQSWRQRHADFPAPLVRLAIGPVWDYPAVAEWLGRERRNGRPRRCG